MPGAYAPDFLQTNAAALADDDDGTNQEYDPGMHTEAPGPGVEPDPASPVTLVGNPGTPPSLPAPQGARPNVPRGPNAVPSAPAPGRAAAPAGGGGYTNIDDNYINAYKEVLKEKFPGMDEKKLNALADYGISKQRGKLAAQNKRQLAQPLGKYFGALQGETSARNNVEALREGMKAKQAEFLRPDGSMAPEWAPYQDKIDAAIMRADQAATKRKQLEQHLSKYGVKPEYLENQVTLMEFMRQLAGGDPSTAGDVGEDDPVDIFGDEQSQDFNPSAGLLQ